MRFWVLAAFAVFSAVPASAADFNPPIARMISNYIQPAMAEFATTADRLPDAVTSVCSDASPSAVAGFRTAYADTLAAFSRIHFLRLGPLLEDDRLSRLAFLPDPRGIAQRQIRKIYAKKDAGVGAAESLRDKSVAVQGLTALQLIAFDKESEVVLGRADADRDFTCAYALAIARNVAAIADDVAADWEDKDGFQSVLLSGGPQNDRYRSSQEAMESVFNALVTGLIIVRDQDLLPALGASEAKARPNRFPFSRSANSIQYLSGELHGLQDAVTSLELEDMTPSDFHWIFAALDFEFGNAQKLLSELEPPLRQTFGQGESYSQVTVLAITLQSIRDTMALELAGALGLAGGFNSLDGD
ncbi:imelysin family protein [Labrenzia sp. 011]|uniref:imelysin family protein n=1 Tax=Labrenzia sp. 011 TaxID=2171494 RepID=UPI000D50F43B|nr:imelysin family protein [Labrenzia sp. 011]PVB61166.1 hypothetical protein DCO57_13130 [Labrenzia sp. 011]